MSWFNIIKTEEVPWSLLLKIKWTKSTSDRANIQFVHLPNAQWLGMYVQEAPLGVDGITVADNTILINWSLLEEHYTKKINEIWNNNLNVDNVAQINEDERKFTEQYGPNKLLWPILQNDITAQDDMIDNLMVILGHESIHKTLRTIPFFNIKRMWKTGNIEEQIAISKKKIYEEISVSLLEGESWEYIQRTVIDTYIQSEFKEILRALNEEQQFTIIDLMLKYFTKVLNSLKRFDMKLHQEVLKHKESLTVKNLKYQRKKKGKKKRRKRSKKWKV